jgi:hypothetical protein
VGPRGGVFQIGPDAKLTRTPAAGDAKLQASTAVTLLADGRWAAIGSSGVSIEGKALPIVVANATAIASAGAAKLVVTSATGVQLIDADSGSVVQHALLHPAHLPISVAADAAGIFYAAPEWPSAARLAGLSSTDVGGHEVFDAEDIMDASLWRMRLPRRHLVTTAQGLVEIAGVGPAVGLVVHAGSVKKKLSLPVMTYAAAASDGNHVYLAGIDRSLYKSYLVSVDISGVPKVVSVEAFTGAASGVAAANGRLFVADADGALRSYAIAANGVATFMSSSEVAQ